jgi:hypothetical protein
MSADYGTNTEADAGRAEMAHADRTDYDRPRRSDLDDTSDYETCCQCETWVDMTVDGYTRTDDGVMCDDCMGAVCEPDTWAEAAGLR